MKDGNKKSRSGDERGGCRDGKERRAGSREVLNREAPEGDRGCGCAGAVGGEGSDKMKWTIYALKDPATGCVRYVGFTSRTLSVRMYAHFGHAKAGQRTHKAVWILSLISAGLKPVIEVLETGYGSGWGKAERFWIEFYRAAGSQLTNLTDGGEGTPGYNGWANLTAEQRSTIARNRWLNKTPEQRSEIAKTRWAKRTPEERRELSKKLSVANKLVQSRLTPEQRSAAGKRANAAMTFEIRSSAARARWGEKKAVVVK